MSHEVYGDGEDYGHENCISVSRGEELFMLGAAAMREMLARFVEHTGDTTMANSIRANWVPGWGNDPGKWVGSIPEDCWHA